MRVRICDTRLALRNSTTRIPFRYGQACMTRCPQALLGATLEVDGRRCRGLAGDCLPPAWFDKSPGKSFAQQIDDMLAVIGLAQKVFAEELATPQRLFHAFLAGYERVQSTVRQWQLPELLASFGISLVERALLDAVARAAGLSFFAALHQNLYEISPGDVHPSLAERAVADWLPAEPTRVIAVRHTVGLSDPLTKEDIPAEERLQDGFPQALEEYLERTGIYYLKLKVANRLDRDLERLRTIAQLVNRRRGEHYYVTLDGNEQYETPEQFAELVEALRGEPELAQLWRNTLVIEQPLARSVALESRHAEGIARLSAEKPVIIDESDGTLDAYARAREVGYRGVSSKNCKGPLKSVLNAGLIWLHNQSDQQQPHVMTGEDLCTVGVIPVQSDLCLVAALGLKHAERNGHHYHRGLSYLPTAQQQAALAAHPDFYDLQHEVAAPRLENGCFHIGSLQCAGFGFAVLPDWADYEPADRWQFASLGLNED